MKWMCSVILPSKPFYHLSSDYIQNPSGYLYVILKELFFMCCRRCCFNRERENRGCGCRNNSNCNEREHEGCGCRNNSGNCGQRTSENCFCRNNLNSCDHRRIGNLVSEIEEAENDICREPVRERSCCLFRCLCRR